MNVTEELAELVLAAQAGSKRTVPLDDLVSILVRAHLPENRVPQAVPGNGREQEPEVLF